MAGAGADAFEGTLELGYQIGFPWSLGVGINFSYTTPNILFDDRLRPPVRSHSVRSVITPNIFPGVSISADLGNGPGIQEVATFSVDVAGPHGKVAVSNAHGTVTGAAGGVLLRPFARLISKAGDSVTTYGEPWNMNMRFQLIGDASGAGRDLLRSGRHHQGCVRRGQQSPRPVQRPIIASARRLLFSCSAPSENRLVWMRPCQAAGLDHQSRGTDHAWCLSSPRLDQITQLSTDQWPGPARRRRPRAANPFVGAMSMGNTVTATTPPSAPTVSMSSPPSKPVTEAVPSQKQRTIKSPTRRRRCACSRGGGRRRAGIADVKSSPAVVSKSSAASSTDTRIHTRRVDQPSVTGRVELLCLSPAGQLSATTQQRRLAVRSAIRLAARVPSAFSQCRSAMVAQSPYD